LSSAAPASTQLPAAGPRDEFSTATYAPDAWHLADNRGTSDPTNRIYSYTVLGAGKFVYASLARTAVLKLLGTWSPSAEVMAMASLEVDISKIAEGTATTVLWRGKPVFIRHRTAAEIAQAEEDDKAELRDPQTDSARIKKKEWLIVMGICTHFGCVPLNGAGDYGGWFCPCHGSHYDTSGRIRRGPAPLNLEVPEYSFIDEGRIILGA